MNLLFEGNIYLLKTPNIDKEGADELLSLYFNFLSIVVILNFKE